MENLTTQSMRKVDNVDKVLLVACGSFDPITNMHLRMFEVAKDALKLEKNYEIKGLISPVNDNYPYKALEPSKHRNEMVRLSTHTSSWISLSEWESQREGWLKTLQVLRHHKTVSDTYFTPRSKKRKILDKNGNIQEDGEVRVMLLCGADLLETFFTPHVWEPEHVEEIVRDHGLVVLSRPGWDVHKFIYEHDTLNKHKSNIFIVNDWMKNEISSTKIRRAIRRGESIKYLLQDYVIEYIRENNLYSP